MLLDRIAGSGDPRRVSSGATTKEDVEALMESVRRNLGRLLNARQGMCETAPDYGLPALTDLTIGSADYVQRVQEAIRVTVEKYEPRLRRLRVSLAPDEEKRQTLAFRIDAVLVGRGGEHRVWYQTRMTGAGLFDVSD